MHRLYYQRPTCKQIHANQQAVHQVHSMEDSGVATFRLLHNGYDRCQHSYTHDEGRR